MKLPRISGEEAIKALVKAGWSVERQRGSHVVLYKEGTGIVVVPLHRELDRGTLRAIIKQSGMTVKEFAELL
ncbi:type II toxin-antitoxin system HicA family toxin [Archaeoglobus veneficus]|uniref:YcfA family protein n=1 Tax=Archaeoglobus veneficus (strain DSM 11195 / SNP6) TaxID=693661 RepID=F2KRI8_ARCVS|nr:type II toxin-antitoxin system HicA family toxin [Archaeoglobus veneficus]AEA46753.1 YcfA family protein [Archaeoglobus veneficus SNP6]